MGNLGAIKDWGYAKDHVEEMWLMLQQDVPDDFVLGTGESHTVREFVELTFKVERTDIECVGSGTNEVCLSNRNTYVKVSKEYYRPLESDNYKADFSKSSRVLVWRPKTTFNDLVKMMVQSDINLPA